ncbi:hypothetical protein [Sphingomonas rubra]|uniref:SpoIIAA-like n=1 Tax=Sphingomonas rubra TaxID=634430 RepID=A0A1I5Q147_9SPHN|nr:hypothetical protein [Sphingomonas rubra]SFP39731.1 hypothetical protein SAMN04488241_101371 [Sphingomonas rubra]
MADLKFELGFDEEHYIQLIHVRGLWDQDQFTRFATAITTMVITLAGRGRPWDVLIDAREFAVQQPAIADAFQALLTRGREVNTGYTAILVASMLAKMQTERVLRHERLRVLFDRSEAMAWLIERRAAVTAS